MKKWLLLASLLFASAAGRSAAQTANANFDKSANFLNYKTYKWVSIPSQQQLDELTAAQLVGTLEVELARKGLTKSKSDSADLFIGYQMVRSGNKEQNHYDVGATYGSAGGATGNGGATITTIHSGQLILDMYDATSKKLVWRGVVSNAIDADAKPDKKQKHMDKAVEKLLKDYPPQKK